MRWDRVSFTGSDFHVLGEVEPTIEQAKGEKKHQDCVDIHIYNIIYYMLYIILYLNIWIYEQKCGLSFNRPKSPKMWTSQPVHSFLCGESVACKELFRKESSPQGPNVQRCPKKTGDLWHLTAEDVLLKIHWLCFHHWFPHENHHSDDFVGPHDRSICSKDLAKIAGAVGTARLAGHDSRHDEGLRLDDRMRC